MRAAIDDTSQSANLVSKNIVMLKHISLGLLLALSVCVVSCGGGGGGTDVSADPLAPPDAYPLAYTSSHYGIGSAGIGGDPSGDAGAAGGAGDGAPLRSALVSLTDAAGHQVSGQTDENGLFLLKYNASVFVAPFVLRVVDAGGSLLTSVLETAPLPGTAALANINPLTDKVTSDSLLADAAGVTGTDKEFGGARIDTAKLAQAKADLNRSIKDALVLSTGLSNVSQFDPVKSLFVQDGTGVDAVVESLTHTRDSAQGVTRLGVKLAGLQHDASGLVQPTLVTANSPLPTGLLALQSSPALTYAKLQAWIAAMNRCLALDTTSRAADTECGNAGGDRMISSSYLNDGSTNDFGPPVGATMRNPVVLFTSRYPGSTLDDAAWVEFTLHSGTGVNEREWTRVLTFKRDDSLVHAKAGNWILHGNQGVYGCGVVTEYMRQIQLNPASALVSSVSSGMGIGCNSSGVHHVLVTGPGLPANGIVLEPNPALSNSLNISSKNGTVGYTPTGSTGNQGGIFIFAAIAPDGTAIDWSQRTGTVQNATTMVTDFSPYQAYAKYSFEIHLTSNAVVTEYAYNLSAIFPPAYLLKFPLNDISPSIPLVDARVANGVAAGSPLTVSWTNNLNAAPVFATQISGRDASVHVAGSARVNSSYVTGNAPTSAVVAATSGVFPALPQNTSAANRLVGILSAQSRSNINNLIIWTH
jgi:hypothetical protein